MIPKKAKKLKPSLREKRHYLVVLVENENPERIVKDAILSYLGEWGLASSGAQIVEVGQSKGKNYAIVSVITKWQSNVKAALALKNLKVIGISGTIKKAKEKFL
jgi:RNase P/RNase MRP subunit POP5